MRRRPLSWNECTTVRDDCWEHVGEASRTSSARRRRSLHRGALRWHRDVNADEEPVKRVLLVALTMKDIDPEVAKGAVEHTFKQLRDWVALEAAKRGGSTLAHRRATPPRARRSELRVPLHDRRLSRGARGGADVLPGDVRGTQASDRLEDRVVEDLAESDQGGQVTRVGVVDAIACCGEHATDHRQELRSVDGAAAATVAGGRIHGKDTLPRFRYLWWAEFQKRGALHYHAILVNPPWKFEREARRWFDSHWRAADGSKLAGIQTWVEWRSGKWFETKAGDYVLKDVRKIAGKRYEQDYERMPRGWRTFRHHQLTRTAAEHQEHETKAVTVCAGEHAHSSKVCWQTIYVVRVDHHVPARGGCRMFSRRKPRIKRSVLQPGCQNGDLVSASAAERPFIAGNGRERPPLCPDVVTSTPRSDYARPCEVSGATVWNGGVDSPSGSGLNRLWRDSLDTPWVVVSATTADATREAADV